MAPVPNFDPFVYEDFETDKREELSDGCNTDADLSEVAVEGVDKALDVTGDAEMAVRRNVAGDADMAVLRSADVDDVGRASTPWLHVTA